MLEVGLLDNQRVELIEGEVLTMNALGPAHVAAVILVSDILRATFGDGFCIRSQSPLHLGNDSEPEPDVAVVTGAPRDFTEHPIGALLVVEVSDTTLAFDRSRKANLYALSGIDDFWIVNLNDRVLEVRRKPSKGGYAEAQVITPSETISPLAMPQVEIAVADMLP